MWRSVAACLAALWTVGASLPAARAHAQAAAPFPVVELREPPRRSHAWANAALIGGAALIGASFHFADRANDAYDRYLAETDPSRIPALYDETVHHDRLSAGTLIAGEVLVATGLYLRFLRPAPDHALELTLRPDRCEVSFRF